MFFCRPLRARMNTIRWILAAPLLLSGVWIILCHWRLVILFMRLHFFGCSHKWESPVPLAGPLFIFLGLFIVHIPKLWHYSWLPLIIDPATYNLIFSLPF